MDSHNDLQLIRFLAGPLRHYRALKSGELKYHKTAVANSIWQLIAVNETANTIYIRFLEAAPVSADISGHILNFVSSLPKNKVGIVISSVIEKKCPRLSQQLSLSGCTVYHSDSTDKKCTQAGAKFLELLQDYLQNYRESMGSVGEIAATCGNKSGILAFKLKVMGYSEEDILHELANTMAIRITGLRGRDPRVGLTLRESETPGAPLNRGKHVPPKEDELERIIRNYKPKTVIGHYARQLKRIRQLSAEITRAEVIRLGLDLIREQVYWTRGSDPEVLWWMSRDFERAGVWHYCQEGMKEILKGPIEIEGKYLHAVALPATIQYSEDCAGLSLRAVPSHHKIESIFSRMCVDPFLNRPVNYYGLPAFLSNKRMLEGYSPFGSRTEINPKQCFVEAPEKDRMYEGLLVATSLSTTANSILSIGNDSNIVQITNLVNERLARTGKQVQVLFGGLRYYGYFMPSPVPAALDR